MKRKYRVIGSRRVHEHDPGDEFEADSEEFDEEALLGVHLEIVSGDERRKAKPDNEEQ